MKTLLRNFDIITTSKSPLIDGGSLLIEDGIIREVTDRPPSEWNGFADGVDEIVEGNGRLLLPGFVNAHTHLGMTIFRGYAEDLQLDEWLEEWIWPAEEKLTPEEVYWGSLLAVIESIKSGVTTVADMYFYMDEAARAIEVSGIRGLISYGVIADGLDAHGQSEVEAAVRLIDDWDGAAQGRIGVALSPHAPYTCGDDVWRKIAAVAEDKCVPIHTHLAETRGEVDGSFDDYGISPVERLENLGVMKNDVMAAHCIYVDDKDVGILADHDVFCLHNPTSNTKLASGIAPVERLQQAGIQIGIATDGAASNNDLDMIEEIRLAALLSKVSGGDPENLPVRKVYSMATGEDVSRFGLEKGGAISEDMNADLIAIDRSAPHWTPEYDSLSNLVYSAKSGDVDLVMVAGKVLMDGGEIKTVDEQEVLNKVKEIARKYNTIRKGKE